MLTERVDERAPTWQILIADMATQSTASPLPGSARRVIDPRAKTARSIQFAAREDSAATRRRTVRTAKMPSSDQRRSRTWWSKISSSPSSGAAHEAEAARSLPVRSVDDAVLVLGGGR